MYLESVSNLQFMCVQGMTMLESKFCTSCAEFRFFRATPLGLHNVRCAQFTMHNIRKTHWDFLSSDCSNHYLLKLPQGFQLGVKRTGRT